jgi:hypothetical protein
VPYALIALVGEDTIAVMDQEAGAMVSWDRFMQLLQGPVFGGMVGYMRMENPAAGVFRHDKHIEEAKRGRDHHAEIAGDDRLGMIAHKGAPALRWDASMSSMVQARGHILPHGPR